MTRVFIDEANKSAIVIVPDYQLSLAIGKEGQNARLAARLTNWKIDIKPESEFGPEEEAALLEEIEKNKIAAEEEAKRLAEEAELKAQEEAEILAGQDEEDFETGETSELESEESDLGEDVQEEIQD